MRLGEELTKFPGRIRFVKHYLFAFEFLLCGWVWMGSCLLGRAVYAKVKEFDFCKENLKWTVESLDKYESATKIKMNYYNMKKTTFYKLVKEYEGNL